MSWFAGTSLIQNNTIDGGTGVTESHGIFLSSGSTPVIQNNIIFASGGTTRYCIFENSNNTAFADLIQTNDLWNTGATTLYKDYTDNTYSNDIDLINGATHADANVQEDPVFVDTDGPDDLPETMDDNDWHPTSPLFSIRYGAIDLSLTFKTDKDGKTRSGNGTDGCSMGAYEY
jgi:hypothetical protein